MSCLFFTQVSFALPPETRYLQEAMDRVSRMTDPADMCLETYIREKVLVSKTEGKPCVKFRCTDSTLSVQHGNTTYSTPMIPALKNFILSTDLLDGREYSVDFAKLYKYSGRVSAQNDTGITKEEVKQRVDALALSISCVVTADETLRTLEFLKTLGVKFDPRVIKCVDGSDREVASYSELAGELDKLKQSAKSKEGAGAKSACVSSVLRVLEDLLMSMEDDQKMRYCLKKIYGEDTPTEPQVSALAKLVESVRGNEDKKRPPLFIDMSPGAGKTLLEVLPVLLTNRKVIIATSLQMVSSKIAERVARCSPLPSIIPVKRVDGGVAGQKGNANFSRKIFMEAVAPWIKKNIHERVMGEKDTLYAILHESQKSLDDSTISRIVDRVARSVANVTYRVSDWSTSTYLHPSRVVVGTFEGVCKVLEKTPAEEVGCLVVDEWDELVVPSDSAASNVRAEACLALQAHCLSLASSGIPVVLCSGTAGELLRGAMSVSLKNYGDPGIKKAAEYIHAHETQFVRELLDRGAQIYHETDSEVRALVRETDSLFSMKNIQDACSVVSGLCCLEDAKHKLIFEKIILPQIVAVVVGRIKYPGFDIHSRILLTVALMFSEGIDPPPKLSPYTQLINAIHMQTESGKNLYFGDTVFACFCQSKNDMQAVALLITCLLEILNCKKPSAHSVARIVAATDRHRVTQMLHEVYVSSARKHSTINSPGFACVCALAVLTDKLDLSSVADGIAYFENKPRTLRQNLFSEVSWDVVRDTENALKSSADTLARQEMWKVATVNAELLTNDAIQDILDARPLFVVTTSKLGAGVDTPLIGVTAVFPRSFSPHISNTDQSQWLARGFRGQRACLRFSLASYLPPLSDRESLIPPALDGQEETVLSEQVSIALARARASPYVSQSLTSSNLSATISDTLGKFVPHTTDTRFVSVVPNVSALPLPNSLVQPVSQNLPQLKTVFSQRSNSSKLVVLKNSVAAPVETIRRKFPSLSPISSCDSFFASLMADGVARLSEVGLRVGDDYVARKNYGRTEMTVEMTMDTPCSQCVDRDIKGDGNMCVVVREEIDEKWCAQVVVTVVQSDPAKLSPFVPREIQSVIGPSLRSFVEYSRIQYEFAEEVGQTRPEVYNTIRKLMKHVYEMFSYKERITFDTAPKKENVCVEGDLSEAIGFAFGSDIILGTLTACVISDLESPVQTVRSPKTVDDHAYSLITGCLSLADNIVAAGLRKYFLPCSPRADTYKFPQDTDTQTDGTPSEMYEIFESLASTKRFAGLSGIARGEFATLSRHAKNTIPEPVIKSCDPCDNPVRATFELALSDIVGAHRTTLGKFVSKKDDSVVSRPGVSERPLSILSCSGEECKLLLSQENWTSDTSFTNSSRETAKAMSSRACKFCRGFANGSKTLSDMLKVDANNKATSAKLYRQTVHIYAQRFFTGRLTPVALSRLSLHNSRGNDVVASDTPPITPSDIFDTDGDTISDFKVSGFCPDTDKP